MTDDLLLVHLAGYSVIAGVLASANWAGLVGSLLGAVFVVVSLAILAREAYRRLAARLRAEAEDAAAARVTATDGGNEE